MDRGKINFWDQSYTPASFKATSAVKTENDVDNRQARRSKFRSPTCNLTKQERSTKREKHQESR